MQALHPVLHIISRSGIMNDHWLETFIRVADLGSFNKAAEKEFISTTAVAQQIRLLEKEVGFSLFSRKNTGVQLTEGGKDFYETAQTVLKTYKDGVKRGREIEIRHRETITVAYTPTEFPNFIMLALSKLGRESSVAIKLLAVPFNDQIEAVNSGRADICIIAEPIETYLQNSVYLPLYFDYFSFAANSRHPFAKKTIIHLEDLKDVPVICGYYPFVKGVSEQKLLDYTTVEYLKTELDLNTLLSVIAEDKVLLISGSWEDQYAGLLSVTPSDIPAGYIGVLGRKDKLKQVKEVYRFLKNEINR